jgi:hypothetical protein
MRAFGSRKASSDMNLVTLLSIFAGRDYIGKVVVWTDHFKPSFDPNFSDGVDDWFVG